MTTIDFKALAAARAAKYEAGRERRELDARRKAEELIDMGLETELAAKLRAAVDSRDVDAIHNLTRDALRSLEMLCLECGEEVEQGARVCSAECSRSYMHG